MLTDERVAEIRGGLATGLRGPMLIKWIEELLTDRDELVAQLRALEGARAEQRQPRR
jgi:hypothetical protein